jgi:hypothetical protein
VRIARTPPASCPSATRARPRFPLVVQTGLLLLAVALGFFIHQQGWHRPVEGFLRLLGRDPASAVTALLRPSTLPTLTVDMRFQDYQRLVGQRDRALRQTANVATDQEYVPATLGCSGASVSVQMRLPSGPAGLFAGDAWPFELVLEGDLSALGLTSHHLTLTPADTTTLSTWGRLETSRRAGGLTPRYLLVRLRLNGSDRGLYALEETPDTAWLAAQGRGGEVLVAYDTTAYWQARAELGDVLSGSGFQYARPVALWPLSPDLTADAAVRTLEALQAGERAPSEVLEVERMADLLAITALWRGAPELDWLTLRLACDPVSARCAPIAAGTAFTPTASLPEFLTDDPVLQVATVRALARFSDPGYLAQLRADLEPDVESLRLALGVWNSDPDAPWSVLEAHQERIRRLLAPSAPLIAAVESGSTGLTLYLGNPLPFPVEVLSLDLGENSLLPVAPEWVAADDRAWLVEASDHVVVRALRNGTLRPVRLRVPATALPAHWQPLDEPPLEVRVLARLFGLEEPTVAVIARAVEGSP